MPFIPGGGAAASSTTLTGSITQANAFTNGQAVYYTGSAFALAQANNSSTSEVAGFVSGASGTGFTLVTSGLTNQWTGLVAGQVYYLSDSVAGGITATEPSAVSSVSKPLLLATSATGGYVNNMRGSPAQGQTAVVSYFRSFNVTTALGTALQTVNPTAALTNPTTVAASGQTIVIGANTAGSISQASNVITIPIAGSYTIGFSALVGNAGTGITNYVQIVKNGASVVSVNGSDASNGDKQNISLNHTGLFAANDTIDFRLATSSAQTTAAIFSYAVSVVQVGASPVPMDLVGEYVAPQYAAANVPSTVGSTTPATSLAFMSITIPTAGTWDIEYAVRYVSTAAANTNSNLSAGLFDSTPTLISNSELLAGGTKAGTSVSGADSTGTRHFTVTTTTSTVYNVRIWSTSGNTNATATAGDAQGRSYMSARKISGLIPTSGQTVDYVNVYHSGLPTVAAGSPIIFDSVSSGNIPYNITTGLFTLSAGKTYKLSSNIHTTTPGRVQWLTSAGVALNPSTSNVNANSAMITYDVIYTPSVNTDVKVQVTTGTATVNIAGSASAVVTQIGSSAVIAGPYPGVWTSYTPTITAPTTSPTLPTTNILNAMYSVQGKTLFINFNLSYAAQAGATAGTGTYNFSIPAGYVIDTTKALIPSLTGTAADSGYDGTCIGTYHLSNTVSNYAGKVVALSTTTVGLFGTTFSGTSRGLRGSASGQLTEGASPTTYSFTAQIPIV